MRAVLLPEDGGGERGNTSEVEDALASAELRQL